MTTVLLVTRDERWRDHVSIALPGASVFVAADDADALRQLRRIEIDLVVWAGQAYADAFVAHVREVAPGSVIIIVARGGDENAIADFVFGETQSIAQFKTVIRQALERHRMLREITTLRAHAAAFQSRDAAATEPPPPASAKLLKEFTRVLVAGFDLSRTLELFIEAVIEFLRPARLALLLPDSEGRAYRVRAHRGLAPQIAESVRLPAEHGLCRWLAIEGRPARSGDLTETQVARELTLLQGSIAVPLLARGELVAVLVVAPLVRNGYAGHEIETLFDLASFCRETPKCFSPSGVPGGLCVRKLHWSGPILAGMGRRPTDFGAAHPGFVDPEAG
jgi:hypothetical protein